MPPKKIKVLFAIDFPEDLREMIASGLAGVDGLSYGFPKAFDDESIIAAAKDADVIVAWRCTPELLAAAQQLKLWIFPGVGVQRLIEPFREINKQRKVMLVNSKSNTYATAQHSVALLFTALNKVVLHDAWMRSGQWRKGDADASSSGLRGKKIGLLGYGSVNSKVHKFLSGFEVEFAVLRRDWSKMGQGSPLRTVQRYNDSQLNYFLSGIDVLMIGVPETDNTRGMIGADELALLGADGYLVNISRGPVVDEVALFNALKGKVIAGAAIDVWYDYRPEPDTAGRKYPYTQPFHELDNIVLSPHRAASPVFDPARWGEIVETIKQYAAGKPLANVVDLDEGY